MSERKASMGDKIYRGDVVKFIRNNISRGAFMKRTVKTADEACWDLCDKLNYVPAIKENHEPHWIPVTEKLPENNDPVNVTWVNHNPEVYYADIKDKPYTATAIYFRGKWFWYSCVIEDWLAEYGSNESFLANLQEAVDRDIEITAWMPLPEPYKGVTE